MCGISPRSEVAIKTDAQVDAWLAEARDDRRVKINQAGWNRDAIVCRLWDDFPNKRGARMRKKVSPR